MNAGPIGGARFIGQRMARKEDARLLTGRGTYVDDVVLPGMLHAAFVRSPIARGVIKSIDVSAARAVPGVRAIYTAEDLDRFDIQMVSYFLQAPPPGPKVYALAKHRVAYVGDPVAIVVADSRYIAEDAAGMVMVDYDAETPVVTITDAKNSPPIHPDKESNLADVSPFPQDPELESVLNAAPHLVTGKIVHQRIVQSPMETRGVVVSKHGDGEITIHLGCQSPQFSLRCLSLAFGVPQTSLRIIAKDVGGSFGLKVQPWREEVTTIAAGMILGRPIKWIEDRLENLTSANQAREQECEVKIAFDADGRLIAAYTDYSANNGAYPHAADANVGAMIFMWAAHRVQRVGCLSRGWYTNTVGQTSYRGPWAIETLARETMLDIAARQIGIDAVEIRRRNLVTLADQPHRSSYGMMLEDVTPAECLETLVGKLDIPAFRAEQAAARKEGRYLGLGIATYIEPTASSNFPPLASETAHVRIEPTGKVTAILSTHSQGHGTQTTMAQVIADRLGVPFEDVSVYEDDSSRGGYGGGAMGSRQAVVGGGASIRAADMVLEKVKRVAAHVLNASIDDVTVENGVVRVAGSEEMTRTLREIAQITYNEPDRLPPGAEMGLEAQHRYRPPLVTFSSAAHACFVEVDAETGFVKIKRWLTSEDCGVMINPAIVEGQVAGGLAQGIGSVLLEEITFDDQGNPTAATFKDYMLPAISDLPEFEYHHMCTPSKSEGGFRGVGEGGAIIGPPTLINAIADALAPFNARCLDLPLTPSKILKLMEG